MRNPLWAPPFLFWYFYINTKSNKRKEVFFIKREWLIAYRKAKLLSQQEVANAIGVNQSTYAAYETGDRKPSPKIAKKLGAVFGFDWTIFFKDE